MGFFAISSKRDSDAVALESRVLIADKDIDRITIAYAQLYFPNGVQEGGDPTADPPIPPDVRPPTGQEVFDAVANGLLQGILANTINQEKATAAKDAQDQIPPIPVEPGV